jgi:hypothetical protein
MMERGEIRTLKNTIIIVIILMNIVVVIIGRIIITYVWYRIIIRYVWYLGYGYKLIQPIITILIPIILIIVAHNTK